MNIYAANRDRNPEEERDVLQCGTGLLVYGWVKRSTV